MKSIVRSRNPFFDQLGYKLLRDKRKYTARCLTCGFELKNTASSRLVNHRKHCHQVGVQSPSETINLAEPEPEDDYPMENKNNLAQYLICELESKNLGFSTLLNNRNHCNQQEAVQSLCQTNGITEPEPEDNNRIENKDNQANNYQLPIIVGAKTISQNDTIDFQVSKKLKTQYDDEPIQKLQETEKIWTANDISLFLDFLKEAKNIEKPTAKIFYENFLRKNPNTNATWKQCQIKLLNFQVTYLKAKKWQSKTDTSPDTKPNEPDIIQMWPYLNDLEYIFGNSNNTNISNGNSSAKCNEDSCPPTYNAENYNTVDDSVDSLYGDLLSGASDVTIAANDNLCIKSASISPSLPTRESTQKSYDNIEVKNAKEFRMELLNRKMNLEERRFEMQAKYKQEKISLKLEIKKLEIDERIRLKEIEERIRLREIEKDENIAKYEIEMKYTRNSGELNNVEKPKYGN